MVQKLQDQAKSMKVSNPFLQFEPNCSFIT